MRCLTSVGRWFIVFFIVAESKWPQNRTSWTWKGLTIPTPLLPQFSTTPQILAAVRLHFWLLSSHCRLLHLLTLFVPPRLRRFFRRYVTGMIWVWMDLWFFLSSGVLCTGFIPVWRILMKRKLMLFIKLWSCSFIL